VNKKIDEAKPYPAALERKIKILTEGSFTGYQNKIFDDIRRVTEPYERYHKAFLSAVMPSKQMMSSMSSIISANNSSIAMFQKSLVGQTWQLEIEKIHKSWTNQFAPLQSMIKEMQAATALDFSSIARSLTVSESITKAFSSLVTPAALGLSSAMIEQLRSEEQMLSESMRSLVDSIAIPRDYLNLPYSSVSGASREIFTSSHAIGTLYPTVQEEVPFDLVEEQESARVDTSECVDLIKLVDPELVRLYNGSLDALESSSADKPRHVLVSLRELWTQILHRLAPNDEVMGWIDPNDSTLLHNDKPTRRARALYICRNVGQGDLKVFVQRDTDSIVTLFDVFNDVHKVNPDLTEDQLRALVLRSESYITYIIQLWRETN